MINYLKSVAEISEEKRKYFKNYKHCAKLIKEAVGLKDVEIEIRVSCGASEQRLSLNLKEIFQGVLVAN